MYTKKPVPVPPTRIDDRDEPEDERDEEEEIPLIAPGEDTEAPEEFEHIDEVREPPRRDRHPE